MVGVVATKGAVPGAKPPRFLGSSRVVKSFEKPVDNWDGWTSRPALFAMFSLICERFARAATLRRPIRDRKVGGSNPIAPTM